jgi:cell division protein FtsN
VSGSFLIPGNADRQKADLEAKGYNPKIIRKNNEFYFVALQSFDSKEDALSELNRLSRELNLPLWVMKN